MRAFVAGATGYVGKAVVRLLVERGVETLAHVRPDSSRLVEHIELFESVGAIVDTTPWEQEAMSQRFRAFQPHFVFGCLGTTAARRRASSAPENETYEAVDYGLTALLVRASAAQETKPRFVYLSSAGTGASTGSAYLLARFKAETAIQKAELPYTIARPAIISGTNREEDRPAERFGAVVGDALLGVAAAVGLGSLRDKWASMTNVQLATAMVDLALSSDGLNRIVDARELRARADRVAASPPD